MMRFPALVPLTALAASLVAVPAVGSQATADAPSARAATRQIAYTQWDDGDQWRRGTLAGVRVGNGRLLIKQPE